MKKAFGWWKATGFNFKTAFFIVTAIMVVILSFGPFYFYDFTHNNPKSCVMCHIMQSAYDKWKVSVHKDIKCGECHIESLAGQVRLLGITVFNNPDAVSPRNGKVIVPNEICMKCHYEGEDLNIKKINKSYGHAKHVFMEKIQCVKCHAKNLHEFKPSERFCLDCHKEKLVHGFGMENLACLDCHTYKVDAKMGQRRDLLPTKAKCLECHGRKSSENFPKNGAMQFDCFICHKPHQKAELKPKTSDCLACHAKISNIPRHKLHIDKVGMGCAECHEPHSWRVNIKAIEQEKCVKCHKSKNQIT
ncbi:MAG: cytochrome c3 family protein [Patescibacteria group bacterium]